MKPGRITSMLQIELLSGTSFSRGEGSAGQVNIEVEHDQYGLPFIGGKTVRGLLRDSWLSMQEHFPELEESAERVLGWSGSLDDSCRLRFGDALLPDAIRRIVRASAERAEHPLARETILAAFTDIRHQTAEDRRRSAPESSTLRSSRVVLRGFTFHSAMTWLDGYQPDYSDLRVLALCSLATRHGGLARNRGRGHIRCTLDGDLAYTRRLVDPSRRRGEHEQR